MNDERSAAIYLIGQGTYYRPRLIEVQYYRIVRHLSLIAEKKQFRVLKTYVDPNARYGGSGSPGFDDLPNLWELCEAIKRGEYRTVFVDLELGIASRGMDSIDRAIEDAGANVVNVNLDTKTVDEAYAERVIPGGHHLPSHASDFIAFFPHLAADIGRILIDEFGRDDHKTIKDRLELLRQLHPIRGESYDYKVSPSWWEK